MIMTIVSENGRRNEDNQMIDAFHLREYWLNTPIWAGKPER